MRTHPVQLRVERPAQMQRVQLLIRLVLLLALGAIGCSSLYWFLYLALPAFAAVLISQKGAERYLGEGGPRIVRVFRWLAAAYAYLWLVTDAFPTSEAGGPVELEVETDGKPTVSSALLRLLYSVPAVLLLAVLSVAAALLWLVGAVVIVVRQRIPAVIADFLALTVCYQFRLLAYHLSLVERYPSLDDVSLAEELRRSDAA